MKVAGTVMLLIALFGLLMLVLSIMSLFQDGNLPFLGRTWGGSFLAIVGLIFAVCGIVGFSRIRRPGRHGHDD